MTSPEPHELEYAATALRWRARSGVGGIGSNGAILEHVAAWLDHQAGVRPDLAPAAPVRRTRRAG